MRQPHASSQEYREEDTRMQKPLLDLHQLLTCLLQIRSHVLVKAGRTEATTAAYMIGPSSGCPLVYMSPQLWQGRIGALLVISHGHRAVAPKRTLSASSTSAGRTAKVAEGRLSWTSSSESVFEGLPLVPAGGCILCSYRSPCQLVHHAIWSLTTL
jgi:hypothetical protein